MTLVELCEPLFQYVCRLNRAGRKGGNFDYPIVRAEIKGIFDEMAAKAASDYRLSSLYKKVELPLIFFVDSMISESALSFAMQWSKNRLGYEQKELAGDEKFFDLLDDTLKDPGEEATEQLTIYYTCLGLGFSGFYAMQPEYLRKKMLEIMPRLRAFIDSDPTARICPEAYQNVDQRNLVEPPSNKIAVITICFIVLTLTALAANFYSFSKASGELLDYLTKIIQRENVVKK